jgi:hypothetical protein
MYASKIAGGGRLGTASSRSCERDAIRCTMETLHGEKLECYVNADKGQHLCRRQAFASRCGMCVWGMDSFVILLLDPR